MTRDPRDVITTRRGVLGGALAAAVLLSGCSSSKEESAVSSDLVTSSPSSAASSNVPVGVGTPTSLTISRIGMADHRVVGLGLAPDGSLTPPAHTIGWYTGSVAPGGTGNAVVFAHVTYDGPDEFARLGELKKGDRVEVKSSTGRTSTFEVDRSESVDKEKLRTRQDVWGPSTGKNLILVTCDPNSGWENSSQQHHVDNTVVWSHLVS